MTCIIGVEHNGKVFIGGDSEVGFGWQKATKTSRKVFRVKNFLIGTAGVLRQNNLLHYYLSPPARGKNESEEHYVIVSLVESIRQCFKDNGYTTITNNKETGGTLLIGYKGKLYRIGSDFDVERLCGGVYAIGVGDDTALGAITALRCIDEGPYTEADITHQIKTALCVSAKWYMGISEPFYVESL